MSAIRSSVAWCSVRNQFLVRLEERENKSGTRINGKDSRPN